MKTALITGASSGIGLATARLLLEQGYQVTGISRQAALPQLAHPDFNAIQLDLDKLEASDRLLKSLLKQQSFDCFIHCAGYGQFGSIEQFSVAQIDRAIRVNLTSALVLCRQLVPMFRRQKHGKLIFMGSESALNAGKKGVLYSAAKFGLRGLCQALREDCAKDGISVSVINPGMVRSPFFDELAFAPGGQPENAIEPGDVATIIWQILQASTDIVVDEINLSPRIKSIDFCPQPGSTTDSFKIK
ncbi:MAG: 3-hydroxy acid dehydrogenase/malonic semialdehyde reductase [Gammaproteobacteria bacterium]|jgi:3-hydroxy acid dehydrogenase/malonic semialdehyde reductase